MLVLMLMISALKQYNPLHYVSKISATNTIITFVLFWNTSILQSCLPSSGQTVSLQHYNIFLYDSVNVKIIMIIMIINIIQFINNAIITNVSILIITID